MLIRVRLAAVLSLIASLVVVAPSSVSAATLTLESATFPAWVSAHAFSEPALFVTIPTSPSTGYAEQAGMAANHAETSYSLSDEGMTMTAVQTRSAFPDSGGAGSGLLVGFFVSAPVFYEIVGSYSVVDVENPASPGSARLVVTFSELVNTSESRRLYDQNSESRHTANVVLTVGSPGGGDTTDEISGQPSGILLPGTEYVFYAGVSTMAHSIFVTDPAYATGSVTLRLLPEPSAPLLGLAASITLAAVRSRRLR